MIYVIATYRILPGALEPFVGASYGLIDASRREPGCLYFDLHASVTDPDRVQGFEQWSDRAAFDRHRTSPHVLAFVESITEFVVSARTELIQPGNVEIL